RNQFDSIGPEHSKVANVLFPYRQRPSIVRVSLRAIAELMAAQRVLRRSGDGEMVVERDASFAHVHGPQQAADAEQYAARIITGNANLAVDDQDAITFRWTGSLSDNDGW